MHVNHRSGIPTASLSTSRDALAAAAAVAALAVGAVLWIADAHRFAEIIWAAEVVAVALSLVVAIVRAIMRRQFGVDFIALVAMVGALALGEYLAGAVVAVMWTGGNALEARATGRARRDLQLLVDRAPRMALLHTDGEVVEVTVDRIAIGDRILVRSGDIVPADGIIESERAVLDESALTGEPLPVERRQGSPVRSGTSNAGHAFDFRATRRAADSAYSTIVRLVTAAEASRAPFLRLADRYAAFFLPLTVIVAGAAWAFTGDPVRALAVVIVATPCPLILAAPVALVSGMSQAARAGVILKGAGAVERLAHVRTVLLDKTGTLTTGTPEVRRIATADGVEPDEVLRMAASVEQLSSHVVARSLVNEALSRDIALAFPTDVREDMGSGIEGRVGDHQVMAGSPEWVRARTARQAEATHLSDRRPEEGVVAVSVDGRLIGSVIFGDHLRLNAAQTIARLRTLGVEHVALVTGDTSAAAEAIGRDVGVDRVYPHQTPEQKLEIVQSLLAQPGARPVMMVGDGINDAPALAAADVGIAMAGAGATVSSETADAVVLVDQFERIADAITSSRWAFSIARQSVVFGLGASVIAMGLAAIGRIAPLQGALLQEGIDLAVIVNALRALRVPASAR